MDWYGICNFHVVAEAETITRCFVVGRRTVVGKRKWELCFALLMSINLVLLLSTVFPID